VKRDIADPIRGAIDLAAADATPLLVLPFPVRQWTRQYQDGLKAFLEESEHKAALKTRKPRRRPART
jgi:hypothetical protein